MSYPDIITLKHPKSPIGEIYRTLRTNIMFAACNKEVKTIAVTSPLTHDGKSTVTANLAITMAQSGSKVLLIDGDLRKPIMHKMFSMNNNTGFTNILAGSTACQDVITVHDDITNLHIMLCGPKPPNPSELLSLPGMKAVMEEFKKRYDYVLIDTPPILMVTDAALIASVCDGAVLVVSSGKTTIENALKSRDIIKNAGSTMLGAVLNKVKPADMDEYYNDSSYYTNRLSRTKKSGRRYKAK